MHNPNLRSLVRLTPKCHIEALRHVSGCSVDHWRTKGWQAPATKSLLLGKVVRFWTIRELRNANDARAISAKTMSVLARSQSPNGRPIGLAGTQTVESGTRKTMKSCPASAKVLECSPQSLSPQVRECFSSSFPVAS